MVALFSWFSGPTPVEDLLERVVLPTLAAVLALDALLGLLLGRWMRTRARLVLRAIAIGAPVILGLFAAFYAWASAQPYGFLGFLGIAVILVILYLAYEVALFALLPSLGGAAAREEPEARSDRLLRFLSPLPPLLAFVLAIPDFLTTEETAAATAGVVILILLAVLGIGLPVLTAVRVVRSLRRRAAPEPARRLSRWAWLFASAYPVTAVLLIVANISSEALDAASPYLGGLVLALLVLLPPVATSIAASALLRAAKEKPAEIPPAPEAPPS